MAQEDPFFQSEGLLDYYTERRREYQETYREEGREEGRRMLLRIAERKFGDETGERLAPLLVGVGTEYMPTVGELVIDCATGEELIARVESLQ